MSTRAKAGLVRIQIDEPWDFEVPGRGNILEARIDGMCQCPASKNWAGKYLLLSLVEAFKWRGEIIKQFLVSPRYEGNTIEDVGRGKELIVGIARIRPHVTLKSSERFTEQQVEYFAIGSVQTIEG